MSNKYIIKNCPGYNKDYSCQSKDNITGKYCQGCTDCVMKQIVLICRDNAKYGDGFYTNPILELLDIEEAER